MKCREAQTLLSAYHDDELAPDVRPSLSEHLRGCARCGEELAFFGKLSAMAGSLPDPWPPQQIWPAIEAELDLGGPGMPSAESSVERNRPVRNRRFLLQLVAAAAAVLVAVGVVAVGVVAIAGRLRHGEAHPSHMAADFGEYLDQFSDDPVQAQNTLLAKYDGQSVDFSQAARQVGYRPAVSAAGLPERYSIDGVYVLKMPCCTCVQTICRREDGKLFAIFEHEDDQPFWFGDKPHIDTKCKGRSCRLIEADRGLVASWKANERQLTVVGANDLEEVSDLITHLQAGDPQA